MIKNPKLVIDVSHYENRLDVPLLKSAGVKAVIVKSGQGMHRDPMFVALGQAVSDGGLALMAYYWDDILFDPVAQAHWAVEDIVATGLPVKYLWADQEQWWTDWEAWTKACRQEIAWDDVPRATPTNISLHNKAFMTDLAGLFPHSGVYTSFGFVQSWAPPVNDWIRKYRLWVAHYGRQPAKAADFTWDEFKANWLPDYAPLVPTGAAKNEPVGHQFSGDVLRLSGVYDSLGKQAPLDVSIFTGSFISTLARSRPPQKPPSGSTPSAPANDAQVYFVNVFALNVRSRPSKDTGVVGTLRQNIQVKVTEMSGNWAHLETGGWAFAPFLTPVA